MTIGSTWMRLGRPGEGRGRKLRAVERLEAIERRSPTRAPSPGDLGVVRGMRASALVSWP